MLFLQMTQAIYKHTELHDFCPIVKKEIFSVR